MIIVVFGLGRHSCCGVQALVAEVPRLAIGSVLHNEPALVGVGGET